MTVPAVAADAPLDPTVVSASRRGCPRAFRTLVRRVEPQLRAWALSWVNGDADEADDVVQDALITIHARLHTLRRSAAIETWLWVVVRNAFIQRYRASRTRRTREAQVDPRSVLSSPSPSPFDTVVAWEASDRIGAAVATLSEGQRRAILQVAVGGWSAVEAAEAAGVRPATVRSNLCKGRRALRRTLALREADAPADACRPVTNGRSGPINLTGSPRGPGRQG